MARATAWTVGLFGAGAMLARTFTAPWLEPIVLLALGIAFLFVSSRSGVRRPRPATARDVVAPTATALAAEQAPAPAPIVVEQPV